MLWLETASFRNLAGSRMDFYQPVSLFYGENAQGKTNILEAISVLGTARSFRGHRPESWVREGAERAAVTGAVRVGGSDHHLEVRLEGGGKSALKDGAPCTALDLLGVMPVVTLSGEDRDLVRGDPQARRDFLDAVTLWTRPSYPRTLQRFSRALRQRNEVLRGYRPNRRDELGAWTETFLQSAAEVREGRRASTAMLGETLRDLERQMVAPESLSITYSPSGEDDLAGAVGRAREEEIRRACTLVGPQRDRVEILIGGRPLALYGSSGQGRTALWMLKLSRLLLLRKMDPDPAVFLLDDVEAELDARRVRELLDLTGGKAQLFLTATRPLEGSWGPMQRFRVERGETKECTGGISS